MRKGVQDRGKTAADHKGTPSTLWAFMDGFQVRKGDTPYLDRLRVVQTPLFGVFLHRIHQPDVDRDPHDHPWPFLSFVLSGGYTERIWADKKRRRNDLHSLEFRRGRWSLHRMRADRAHRILSVEDQLWTLVLTGPRKRDWGFWTNDGLVLWRDYLAGCDSEDVALWGGAHP